MPRYRPKNIAALRRCLRNCPAEMSVEIERGVPVTAKIVAELRSLPGWPYGLVLIVHIDPDPDLAWSRWKESEPDASPPTSPSCRVGTAVVFRLRTWMAANVRFPNRQQMCIGMPPPYSRPYTPPK